MVRILHREPADGDGSVVLSVAPVTFNYTRAADTAGLIDAIQDRIAHKTDRDQWGDTADLKWLLIVLDDSKAADDLLRAFEFDDHQHDFAGIALHGLDEVWAIAFDDGHLTVLSLDGSGWEHHPAIPIFAETTPGTRQAQ